MGATDRTIDEGDPLTAWSGRLERLNYRVGMMLDDQDFRDEQTFHRASLALVLRHALGMGTLAGLQVELVEAAPGGPPDASLPRLRVAAGVAIDRRGRLVCLDGAQSLRLSRWLADQPKDALDTALDGAAVTADVFMSLTTAELQKTQIFADGPFDGPDAVAPARLESRPRIDLLLRPEKADALAKTEPRNLWSGDGAALWAKVIAEQVVFGDAAADQRLREHPGNADPDALFLARVRIGVTTTAGVYALAGPTTVDSSKRPVIALPGKWLAAPPDPP